MDERIFTHYNIIKIISLVVRIVKRKDESIDNTFVGKIYAAKSPCLLTNANMCVKIYTIGYPNRDVRFGKLI